MNRQHTASDDATGTRAADRRSTPTPYALATVQRKARGTVRGTWRRVMAIFVLIVFGLGATTIGFTRWQRSEFKATTSHFERRLGTVAELQQEMLVAEIPIGGVLYELTRVGTLGEQWQQFQQHDARIREFLTTLRGEVAGSDVDSFSQASREWSAVADGVAAAKAMWGTGEVGEAMARGEDPFGLTVWASLSEAQEALASLAVRGAADMRDHGDDADRRQTMLEALLVAAVAAALVLSAMAGSRLSRRVIRPLSTLRAGTARVRDGDLTTPVEVMGSWGREILELAQSMNEMATALNRSHGQLRDLAYTDGLTGLANRRAMTEHLQRLFPVSGEDTLALLLIDLDDFKFVNDSMGHAAGDALLVAVAGRLRQATREGDLVARLGGDEFAVVVLAHDAQATASVVAERILGSLQTVVEVEGTPVSVGCSIGIAIGQAAPQVPDELVRNADVAMYMAKSQGKHCANVFDGTMYNAMLARVELKRDLALVTERGELELHYQPVVELESSEILGFEALVRWRHPDLGLIPPCDFIPLAEETGDIVSIGGWVLERACRDLSRYQQGSGSDRKPWIAVNVSAHQIAAGEDFVASVRSALSRHNIRPDALVLEITEGALLLNIDEAHKVLTVLRRDGVKVAVDDFGTGFSSLGYLHELPIDCIKIDRSFIAASAHDDERDMILESIVSMGRRLGLDLVAEGIEQESERDRLRALGAMAGQGYLIARPMLATDVLQLLRRRIEVSPPAAAAH